MTEMSEREQAVLLLVLRAMGPEPITKTHAVLKGFKDELAAATKAGLIATTKKKEPVLNADGSVAKTAKGTPRSKAVTYVGLSEQGEAWLNEQASPAERRAAEALGAEEREGLQELAAEMKRTRDALVQQVQDTLEPLQARISSVLGETSGGATGNGAARRGPKPVAGLLREAYGKLRMMREYSDGIVDIPEIYREARQWNDALTLEEVHEELQRLWQRRELELRIANDPQAVAEPTLGIRDERDRLRYYVYWPEEMRR